MSEHRHTVRVGVFSVASLALVALVLIVFGGMKFWKHHDHYYIDVDDTVLGLTGGAQVYLNGIEVGQVTSIATSPAAGARVRVAIEVARGTPIHADARALLTYAGITGLKIIDLRGGTIAAPLVPAGGAIAAGRSAVDKLEQQAEQLATESESIVKRANTIVDSASRMMANLEAVSDPAPLQAIIAQTNTVAANLADASGTLKAMAAESRATLRATLASVDATARGGAALVDDKLGPLVDGASGLVADLRAVVHGNEGAIQAAMADLRQAARTFKDLSREVRERPSRLLFATPQAERKLP